MMEGLRAGSGPRGAALGGAAVLVVIVAVLGVQHLRHGWPFSLHHGPGPTALAPAPAVPAQEHAAHARAAVELDARQAAGAGAGVVAAQRETLAQPIRSVATVMPDEARLVHLHTRVSGWLEEVYVATTGSSVKAGQPVAAIFSQELYASQEEYLAARRQSADAPRSAVLEGARSRLKVLGLSEGEIAQIERSGQARRLVTLYAPRSGVVLRRTAAIGTAVDPSTEILTIADLSQVWVMAELPESESAGIVAGTPAKLDFASAGRAPFEAAADFVYPTLSERTRSLRVRFAVPNADGALRPGVYGAAEFAARPREVITVPRDAVVDTGESQHVFVQTGPGRYEPRTVTLGLRLADRVEVRSGLQAGEHVAASGVFLIDSESRLRASGAGGEEGAAPAHGGH